MILANPDYRAPFVLSADMAYVINHGDKTARSFHRFVDMCTKAFNLLRLRWREILSIIQVSVPMGMICLKGNLELRLLHHNLSPDLDDFRSVPYSFWICWFEFKS